MRQRGFTLIELIVTIVLTTIVMGFAAMFMGTPVQTYIAQTRRASLTDSAEAITRNIATDVRTALPNSTRIVANGSIVALEMLATVDVSRYRAAGDGPDAAHELQVGASDNEFYTLAAFARSNYFAVVNENVTANTIYGGAGVLAPVPALLPIVANETHVTLAAPFNFTAPGGSPSHSVFLVSAPVSYLCDTNAGTLTKYSGYAIDPLQANRDSDAELMGAGAARSLIATNITACTFSTAASTKWHGDLVTFRVMVSNSGDNMPVFHQAQVGRRP